MEYDLETFLDEYQPLFKSEHHKQNYMTRLEQLKKRYFSGILFFLFLSQFLLLRRKSVGFSLKKFKRNVREIQCIILHEISSSEDSVT